MSQKDVNYRKRKHTFDQLMKTATDIDRQIHAACLSNVCVEERTAVHEQFFPRAIDETGRMRIPDFDPHSFDLLSSYTKTDNLDLSSASHPVISSNDDESLDTLRDDCNSEDSFYDDDVEDDNPDYLPRVVIPEFDGPTFAEKLSVIYVQTRVPHTAIKRINGLLREHGIDVPKSARTHLKTVKKVHRDGDDQSLYHFGIIKGLVKKIKRGIKGGSETVELQGHIDGIPLSNSSSLSFWPIQIRMTNGVDTEPWTVTVFQGPSKPPCLDSYLGRFISEIKELMGNGIDVDGVHYAVNLKSVIADAPARAMLKGIIGHGAYGSCERCPSVGVKSDKGTVIFPDAVSVRRTDESFRKQEDPLHHLKFSFLKNFSSI